METKEKQPKEWENMNEAELREYVLEKLKGRVLFAEKTERARQYLEKLSASR